MSRGKIFTPESRKKIPPRGPGKLTTTVRETVLNVFTALQSDPKNSLQAFADKYPRDFYQMAAKLIPMEITGTLKTIINVEQPNE